ncbi:FbpB family small basic protein [Salsuginibacillus kocurii]|nr:FbpB family small basic protein [Salsuginibacillus kocurii]
MRKAKRMAELIEWNRKEILKDEKLLQKLDEKWEKRRAQS